MTNPATHAHGSWPVPAHAKEGSHNPRDTTTRRPIRRTRVREDCAGLTAARSTRTSAPPKSASPTTYTAVSSADGGRVSRNGTTSAHA